MDKKFIKMILLIIGLIINVNVFATGSIAIEGHVLVVDYQKDNFIIKKVIVKDADGNDILYQSLGCNTTICSYNVGPLLAFWGEVIVVTNQGSFTFQKN